MLSLSVCVFCGSRAGKDNEYKNATEKLGRLLAEENCRLVYGGGNIGLMGIAAENIQSGGGEVMGVIPEHLLQAEVGKTDIHNFIVTQNMHERKKVMFMNCEAIIIIPGGVGTLDEFFEVLTWAQLKLHSKPIIILNVKGFWDPLIKLINHLIENGFADESLSGLFKVVTSPEEAIGALKVND
tara:strand:- start:1380 stop:1928 length:549 start_codon:yes stop_codon:yes gene_type:complete